MGSRDIPVQVVIIGVPDTSRKVNSQPRDKVGTAAIIERLGLVFKSRKVSLEPEIP